VKHDTDRECTGKRKKGLHVISLKNNKGAGISLPNSGKVSRKTLQWGGGGGRKESFLEKGKGFLRRARGGKEKSQNSRRGGL